MRTGLLHFIALTLTLLGLCAFSGCSDTQAPTKSRIVLTADIRGRLVPCGCFTGQLGGMTRLDTVLSVDSGLSELRVDAGDAIQGGQDFEVMEYRRILDAFQHMQFQALNIGAREAQLPALTLQSLLKESNAPLISANLLDATTGEPIAQPFIRTKLDGHSVIITGVLDPSSIDPNLLGDGLTLKQPDLVLRELLPQLRNECDLLVLLAFADENHLRTLAEQFYEADFILGGDVSQPSGNTRLINQSHVFYVANESRTIGLIDFECAPSPQHKRPQITINHARPELLYEEIPESEAIRQLAIDYREAVRTTKLAIDDPESQLDAQIPGVRARAHYVDNESCRSCHVEAYETWQKSGHAHAWSTLQHVKADADPSCIACHSVGFGTTSGYRREFKAEKLVNVGCQSCHGPGSQHVTERSSGGPINFHFRPLAEGDCRSCHYGEFSRPFDWDAFWPRIAHGAKPTAPTDTP